MPILQLKVTCARRTLCVRNTGLLSSTVFLGSFAQAPEKKAIIHMYRYMYIYICIHMHGYYHSCCHFYVQRIRSHDPILSASPNVPWIRRLCARLEAPALWIESSSRHRQEVKCVWVVVKVLSPYESPKYQVPYYSKDPKRDHWVNAARQYPGRHVVVHWCT